jgi:hypothetical protein
VTGDIEPGDQLRVETTSGMASLGCPFGECPYVLPDVNPALAAVYLSPHIDQQKADIPIPTGWRGQQSLWQEHQKSGATLTSDGGIMSLPPDV